MNDVGLTLAWLVVQIAILLAPALVLHGLASRRGPAPGAWVASLSLGLVVVLNVAAFVPRSGWKPKGVRNEAAPASVIPTGRSASVLSSTGPAGPGNRPSPSPGRGLSLAWLRLAWDRIEHGTAEPAARFRPWGSTLAAVAMAGTGVGLLNLILGLWAVALCRRRGRPVDDPQMMGLLEELRLAMGCVRPVELREVPDLTTPATAGRRRPVVMLPDDWRSWSEAERRAVLAHELAHIVRGDYAAGLLARLAVVLNYYHPLVRWMAGRLQLQQEQAADAMGARFAGGSTRYLVALSSLALRQDGRSPGWPARAFLPARGTLIRRIAMLRDESRTRMIERPWTRSRRMVTAFGLLGLAVGVATLRVPAWGAEEGPSPAAPAVATLPEPREQTRPPFPIYLRKGADGILVVRPAAAFRHKGMDRVARLMVEELSLDLSEVEKQWKIDTSRPGFLKLRCEDVEWLSASVGFGHTTKVDPPLHSFRLGNPVIRMAAPFDWLAFLRQWRVELEQIRVGGRGYYKVIGPYKELLLEFGKIPCVFVPDDRTIIIDEEDVIRKMASGEYPASPSFLKGRDWEQARRGLLAVAIKNSDDTFEKHYDLGRPDDAMVLPLFKGIDWWVFGVDDADAIVLHADAISRGRDVSEAVSRQIDSLLKMGRKALEQIDPKSPEVAAHDLSFRMLKALAANVRVNQTDHAVTVHAQGFGTLADFAAIVEGEAKEESDARVAAGKAASNSTKR